MTGYAIEIQDTFGAESLPAARMTSAIAWVLARHDAPPGAGLTVVITDDEQVRALNAQYRGVDAATDVLSFGADPLPEGLLAEMAAQGESDGEANAPEGPYLGDLVVAYPYTVRQAQEAGHALDDELILLAIHGTLHLLGHDHDNPERQRAMWMAQAEALAAAGVDIEVPTFTFEDEGDERA